MFENIKLFVMYIECCHVYLDAPRSNVIDDILAAAILDFPLTLIFDNHILKCWKTWYV